MDDSSQLLESINEIRDLLRVIAEPAMAEHYKKQRSELRRIVGNSVPKSKAVFLLDGTRTQAEINKEIGIHKGHLSDLVKKLSEAKLLQGDPKQPKPCHQYSAFFL